MQQILSGGNALADFAVSKNRITAAQGEALKTDFRDAIACETTREDTVDQIAKDDPDAKRKKLNAWATAGRCWKTILARQNFAADPQFQRIANIVDGIFAAGIVFYSESGTMRASAEGTAPAVADDKDLERDLQKRMEELKQAMKRQ